MYPRRMLTVIFSCFVFLSTGCLTKKINKLWPPVQPPANQLKAIDEARSQLDTLRRIDFFVAVQTKELQALLPGVLVQEVPSIKSATVTSSRQQIEVRADFDHLFHAEQIRVAGNLTVNGALSVVGQELIIRPSFSTVHLSRLSIKKPVPGPIVDVVNALLRQFLDNINGAIAKQTIHIKADLLAGIRPDDLVKGLPGVNTPSGNEILFDVGIDRATLLVDETAIRVVGKLTENRSLIPYRDRSNITPAGVATLDAVASAFDSYRAAFSQATSESLGSLPSDIWNGTSASVSKAYVAGLLNSTMSSIDWRAGIRLPSTSAHFEQTLRADSAPDLRCQQQAEARSCDIQLECGQSRDCNPNWSCPDCAWYDVGCHARRAGCEADKVRYRTQCEIEKKVAHDSCEVEKTARRVGCETEKAAQLVGCNANQTWLNSWSGAAFGRVQGDVDIATPTANVRISRATVQEDLAALSITSHVQARADLTVGFLFTPLDAGHLACQAPWGGNVSFGIDLNPQVLDVAGSLSVREPDPSIPGALSLQFVTKERTLTLKTTSPPVLALLAQNPQFFIVCSPVASLGLQGVQFSQKLREDLIKDSFDVSIPSQTIPITVMPTKLTIFETSFTLAPQWGDRFVAFVVTK